MTDKPMKGLLSCVWYWEWKCNWHIMCQNATIMDISALMSGLRSFLACIVWLQLWFA